MDNWWEEDETVEATPSPVQQEITSTDNWWEEDDTASQDATPAPVSNYEGLTFDNLTENKQLMQTIRDFYTERDQKDFSGMDDLEVAKEFVFDRMWKDQNLALGAGPELAYVMSEASEEQKARLAELRKAWDELPAFWEEGGRGFVGLAENIGTALMDPITLITGGVGGAVGKEVAKKGAGKAVSTAAGVAAGATAEGAAGAGVEAAHQGVEIETGLREEMDLGQVGLAGVVSGIASVAPMAVMEGGKAVASKAAKSAKVHPDPNVQTFRDSFQRDPTRLEKVQQKIAQIRTPGYLRQKFLDKYASLRTGPLGDELGKYWENDVYRDFRLFEAAGNQVAVMLENGSFNWANAADLKANPTSTGVRFGELKFNKDGKSLVKVFEPLQEAEGGVSGFLSYIAAHRARQLKHVRGKKIPLEWTDDVLDATIRDGDANPAYQKALKDFREYNDNILDLLQTSGVLGAEDVARISEANGGWYVPFYRVLEDTVTQERRMRGRGVSESGLAYLRGGEEMNVGDLLNNVIMNTEAMVTAALYNATKRSLFDRLSDLPEELVSQFAVRVPADLKAKVIPSEQIKASLEKAGMDMSDFDDFITEDAMTFWSRIGKPKDDNIQVVMRNGKAEYWQVSDPLLLESLNMLGHNADFGWLARQWAKGKRLFTKAVTHEPTFVFRNMIRDSVSSTILSRNKGVPSARQTPIVNVADSLYLQMKNDPEYADFILNGGGFSGIHSTEMGLDHLKMREAYVRRNIDPDSVILSSNKFFDMIKTGYAHYDLGLSSVENASRFSEFRQMRSQGMSVKDAAFAGRDVATDFSMKGSSKSMQFLTTVAPFFNPGVQGLYHTARRFRQDPVSVGFRAFMGITVPSLMLQAYNKDYEVVQNQPDYIKDTHWIFPVTEDGGLFPDNTEDATRVILIPKPYDIGALFASVPERIAGLDPQNENIIDDVDEFTYHFYRILTDQMLLDPSPYGWEAMTNQMKNQRFGGAPIVPPGMEGIKKTEQKRPDTNVLADQIAQATGQSPMRVEQLIRDLFGSAGSLVIDAADAGIRRATDIPDVPVQVDEWPVMKAFVRMDPMPSRDEIDFYNLIKNVGVSADTYSYFKKEGMVEDITKMLQSTPRIGTLMGSDKALNAAVREFGKLNRQVRRIQSMPDDKMTAAKKLEEIKKYKKQSQDVISRIMTELRKDPLLRAYMRESNMHTFLFR